MIIYEKDVDDVLEIPCGLGPVICEDTGHDLQMKQVDSSTELQHVEPDEGYFGLYRVIVNPYELDSKAVNSSTETQTVTSDRDGLSSVTVNPYTVESQSDTITVNGQYTYTADNADALSQVTIDVSIKTIPDLQAKTVDSSTVEQNVEADSSYDGLSSVTVNPYVLDSKTVNPSTNQVNVTSDEDGLSSVTVNAVTAAIDPDIVAGNIKKDVEILGVIGSFEGGTLQSKTVNSSTSSQTVTPDGANYGLSSVTVNPYSVESKSDTITVNGQYSYSPTGSDALSGVTIDVQVADIPAVVQTKSVVYTENGEYTVTKDAGYDGMSSVDVSVLVTPVLESAKTVNSSTTSQTVTYDNTQYDGLSSVTVNPYTLENKSVDSSTVQQSITATSADGLAMVTVNPYTLDSKTVDASTVSQTVTSSNDGLSSVTVNPYVLDNKTVNSSTSAQTVTSDVDGLSSVTVNPYTLDSKTVDSSTVSQTITSSEDGLSSVIVNPYTLQSKTIQNGSWNYRSNLTVTPDSSYNGLSQVVVQGANTPATTRTFNPTTSDVTYDPADYGYDFWRSVKVKAVTASIDPDIQPENIKKNVEILGVIGTYEGAVVNNQNKTVDASTVSQSVTADASYTGLGIVTVNPYTLQDKLLDFNSDSQWDPSTHAAIITPDSGYDGLSSVGVTLESKTVDPSTSAQIILPTEDSSYFALDSVTVNAVTAAIDPDIIPGNIKAGVNILGVNGTLYSATIQNSKAAADITLEDYYNGTYIYVYPDQGYDGMYEVKAFGGHNNYVCTRLRVDSDFMQHVRVEETDTNKIEFYSRSYPHKISASNNTGYIVKDCSYVEEIGFYNFYSIDSNVTLHHLITNCPKLAGVRFDAIINSQGGVQGDVSTWIDPDEIQNDNFTVGVNWTCLTSAYRDPTYNLLYAPGSKVKRVFITSIYDTVTDSIYLEYSSGLNVYGVYNVLSALNLTVTGKSVTFASGLTVTDTYGGGLQQKYNEVVNAGWTINNLTILPYGS